MTFELLKLNSSFPWRRMGKSLSKYLDLTPSSCSNAESAVLITNCKQRELIHRLY